MSDQPSFAVGETVKVIGGLFASFTGNIKGVNQNRQMLLVIVRLEKGNPLVKAGSGGVPVELKYFNN